MVSAQFVVAVGDDQQHLGLLQPPPDEHQQVQGRLVGPVRVLYHDDLPRRPRELVQERGEDGLPRPARGEQLGQPAACLAGDVVQGPQRTGGQQRVAGAEQEPGLRRVPLGEPPDQRRLADAGLAGHQGDEAAGRRFGEDGLQRRVEAIQFGVSADERRC
jgi:hypothetical protein